MTNQAIVTNLYYSRPTVECTDWHMPEASHVFVAAPGIHCVWGAIWKTGPIFLARSASNAIHLRSLIVVSRSCVAFHQTSVVLESCNDTKQLFNF